MRRRKHASIYAASRRAPGYQELLHLASVPVSLSMFPFSSLQRMLQVPSACLLRAPRLLPGSAQCPRSLFMDPEHHTSLFAGLTKSLGVNCATLQKVSHKLK